MSDDYAKYERASKRIRKDNAKLLDAFDQWLAAKGLSEKTIEQHVRNVDFYINTFLLYSDAVPAKEGASAIWSFFGNWFIRKKLWTSQNSMRQIGVSLKRFFTFNKPQPKKSRTIPPVFRHPLMGWLSRMFYPGFW